MEVIVLLLWQHTQGGLHFFTFDFLGSLGTGKEGKTTLITDTGKFFNTFTDPDWTSFHILPPLLPKLAQLVNLEANTDDTAAEIIKY